MNRSDGAVVLLLLLASCGEVGSGPEDPGPDTLTLVPTDTVGVPEGDALEVFGAIGEAGYSPSGDLVVLDRTACEIRFFDGESRPVGVLGGHGSGPGEFLSPTDFAFLSDGMLAVADWGARTIWLFDDSLRFAGSTGVFPGGCPSGIEAGPDGAVVGLGIALDASGSGIGGESFVGRWDRAGNETARYGSTPVRVVPEAEDRIRIEYEETYFTVDREGRVHACEASDSLYRIRGYEPGGDSLPTLSEPWTRIGRTDTEIAAEALLMRSRGIDGEPGRYRQAIGGLLTDTDGNLWVRLGAVPYPLFLVYSPEGDTLFFAECRAVPDSLFSLRFSIGRQGMLAWDGDPSDYPKVIRFELPGWDR